MHKQSNLSDNFNFSRTKQKTNIYLGNVRYTQTSPEVCYEYNKKLIHQIQKQSNFWITSWYTYEMMSNYNKSDWKM